jgi:hypothetical protein
MIIVLKSHNKKNYVFFKDYSSHRLAFQTNEVQKLLIEILRLPLNQYMVLQRDIKFIYLYN